MAGSAKERLIGIIQAVPGLDAVEELVQAKFDSDAPLLSEIPQYLFALGGKRMRPILSLLSARALGLVEPSRELIDVAAGIELIHMATLLHDDIIDRSPLRRHQDSPFIKFGLESTLLSGDFLLVRAFSLCARLDTFIIDSTEQACIELTEGEILETPLHQAKHDQESSLNIARKKTASLFRLATRSAAHLAHAGAGAIEAMSVFGEKLGVAFQVLDDILDVTSSEDLLGKKSGIDLRERKPSLVNVLWLQSGSALAARLADQEAIDDQFIEAALQELRQSDVIAQARAIARQYTDAAARALDHAAKLAPTTNHLAITALQTVLDYTLERME